jgi:Uma2 family endonuclease
MATKSAVSIDEYLHTSYPSPDPEYRDGEIVERGVPDYKHGRTQLRLGRFFEDFRDEHRLFAAVETRIRVGPGRVLVPDVVVFHPEPPQERVPSSPAFLVVEVLSDDDRMIAVREKLDEYRAWGVRHVWLVDPESRRLYVCDDIGLREVASLTLPEFGLEVTAGVAFD